MTDPQQLRQLRAKYREDTKSKRSLLIPRWGAYKSSYATQITDFLYVDDEPFTIKDGHVVYAHSLTQTPRGELCDIARLEEACAAGERRKSEKAKIAARGKLQRAVRLGRIARGCCEVCGSANAEAHHDDYAKPLDVRWVCRLHHDELHHPTRVAA